MPYSVSGERLKLILESKDAQDADLEKAIRLSEETYCPVWAMLKGTVDVVCERTLV